MEDLKDTIDLMISPDYKSRFKAEFFQLCIRRYNLKKIIEKMHDGDLEFTPASDQHIYYAQIAVMDAYISLLKLRAEDEGIILNSED